MVCLLSRDEQAQFNNREKIDGKQRWGEIDQPIYHQFIPID
ncbi:hypothetical protein M595_6157, partial [Lyngbya aestuarii BL J]